MGRIIVEGLGTVEIEGDEPNEIETKTIVDALASSTAPAAAAPAERPGVGETLFAGVNRGLGNFLAAPSRLAGMVVDPVMDAGRRAFGLPESTPEQRSHENVLHALASRVPKVEETDQSPGARLRRVVEAAGRSLGESLPLAMAPAAVGVLQAGPRAAPGIMTTLADVYRTPPRAAATLALETTAGLGSGAGEQSAKEAGAGRLGQSTAGLAGGLAPSVVGGVLPAALLARGARQRGNVAAIERFGEGAAPPSAPGPATPAVKSILPPDVVQAFRQLGAAQRDVPERAMLRVQRASGGGVLNPMVEHTGDLTHRMSHMAEWGDPGQEFVLEKTARMLRALRHGYGFEREMLENFNANAAEMGVSVGRMRAEVDAALEAYRQAHEALPVYNRPQWLAREAAVAVGRKDWAGAERLLTELDTLAKGENWHNEAFAFKRDAGGKLQTYEPILARSTKAGDNPPDHVGAQESLVPRGAWKANKNSTPPGA